MALYERGPQRLAADLETGGWYRRHADLLTSSTCDAGYRALVAAA
jgi:hypothetical protein